MYKKKGENTIKIQKHIPSCFGVYYVRSDGVSEYKDFFGETAVEDFVKKLEEISKDIFDEYWEEGLHTNLTEEEQLIIPDEEIIGNKNIKFFNFRYRLKYRFMPQDQYQIGMREKSRATKFYLCEEDFNVDDKRVIDHDHVQGKYLGIAHDACNLKRMTEPTLRI